MNPFREKVKVIIFGTDTKGGKIFDIVLIVTIVLSIITVLLDSVVEYSIKYGYYFYLLEWTFTILFSLEYFLRIYSIRKPKSYIFSFFGIIDFLAIIPTYISYFFPRSSSFLCDTSFKSIKNFSNFKTYPIYG